MSIFCSVLLILFLTITAMLITAQSAVHASNTELLQPQAVISATQQCTNTHIHRNTLTTTPNNHSQN